MGLAIGMFIALFAVGIALFVIEQNKAPPGALECRLCTHASACRCFFDARSGVSNAPDVWLSGAQ